ncbi:MAG: DUF4271 domain-containing protein [Rikenellaceae bacterium]
MDKNLKNITDIPAYIFGSESTIGNTIQLGEASLWHLGIWSVAGIFLFIALYLMWLNHWSSKGHNHSRLFGLQLYFRKDLGEKLSELSPSFSRYTLSGTLFYFAVFWVAIVTFFALMPTLRVEIAAIILAAIALIYIYQILLVNLIGKIINHRDFAKLMLHIKGMANTMIGIMVVPTILCYALTNGKAHDIFMYIVAVQFFTITMLYTLNTFIFFISKKFSVLHTILYLCAVEIFPITLFWGFFNR